MKTLKLSKDLDIPADIATEAVAFVGARGSGKTHGTGKLAEELHAAGVQFVVLDPVGVWYGLRLAKDGKSPGLKIPIFGGLHGDVPLEPGAGALVADVIVDRRISAVLDVSQFDTDADKARFTATFSDRLFQRQKRDPSVIAVIIDEGQEFVPQNPQPGEQMMLHRLIRQIKIGRNFGMGVIIVTPRPQEINKKALNGCQTVFAFRLTGAHERKAMKEWIAAHDVDGGVIEKLPSLETGTCHVWSPAFLKVNKEIRISPKKTFDASATPKVGEHRAARELAPIDLEELRESMKATIEKARQEDPKALLREITILRGKLAAPAKITHVSAKAIEKIVEKPVEVPVIKDAQLKRVEALALRVAKDSEKLDAALNELTKAIARTHAGNAISRAAQIPPKLLGLNVPVIKAAKSIEPIMQKLPKPWGAPIKTTVDEAIEGELHLGPSHQRILNALATLEIMGRSQGSRGQVGLMSKIRLEVGHGKNIVSQLKTAGYLIYPDQGFLQLTDLGRSKAMPSEAPQNSEQLQALVKEMVGPSHRKIIDALIGLYPQSVSRTVLNDAIGIDVTVGHGKNIVSELRTLGAVDYPGQGQLRASEMLFLEAVPA